LIAKDAHGEWVFAHGKHQGRTLETVAEEDPSYLQWMYSKASDGLSKEAFYSLEDIMEKHDIEVP
jgi:hypothetical protein